MRRRSLLSTWSVTGLILLLARVCVAQEMEPNSSVHDFDKGKVFDEVAQTVSEHFYKTDFDLSEWAKRCRDCREKVIASQSLDEFATGMNELLSSLETSHTFYYSRHNPKRYQLLGVFHQMFEMGREDLFEYEGIGIDTRVDGGKVFVSAVYDGHPASSAGLKYGDQILSVDDQPFHPIASFIGRKGNKVAVSILRGNSERIVPVEVDLLDGRTMFEKAMDASVKILERSGKKVGYIHAWSYAGTKYQEKIRDAILWGKLSQCDSLILDLRDGWGGADVNYLSLFRDPIVTIQTESRSGKQQNYTGTWGKPLALITNEGSTSGKELFAYGFKKLRLGKVIGEKTAGAVVAGRIFVLSNGDVLYLAVSGILVDGNLLEGVGVNPDASVPMSWKSSDGSDPQLEKALESLTNHG